MTEVLHALTAPVLATNLGTPPRQIPLTRQADIASPLVRRDSNAQSLPPTLR